MPSSKMNSKVLLFFLIICLVSGFELFCVSVCLYVSLCVYMCMCFSALFLVSFFCLFVSLFILFLSLFAIFYLRACFLDAEGNGRVGKWKGSGKR